MSQEYQSIFSRRLSTDVWTSTRLEKKYLSLPTFREHGPRFLWVRVGRIFSLLCFLICLRSVSCGQCCLSLWIVNSLAFFRWCVFITFLSIVLNLEFYLMVVFSSYLIDIFINDPNLTVFSLTLFSPNESGFS